jgi:isopentenyl-diphosphate delta-isomerase type 1
MTETEYVILVDQHDAPIGVAEKLEAHRNGLCHRAFSVFIFRQNQELLLQQRAKDKYHSPGLWTNTCCSHPRPDEDIIEAGERRLLEEMGITAKLQSKGQFHYTAQFSNGLIENEIDYVLVGTLENDIFHPNPAEVHAYRWITLSNLEQELARHPEQFTPWLKQALGLLTN